MGSLCGSKSKRKFKMWNSKEVIEEDHKVCEAWEEFVRSKNMEVLAWEKDDWRVAMRTGDKEIIVVRDHEGDIVYRCV